MIIPIRCVTCAKVIADKWEEYLKLIKEENSEEIAFKKIGFNRYCCKRMFLTHVDINQPIIPLSE
jgi:DNA-directed RNA polymerase I, II, and III subunit RPABC5